MRAMLVGRSLRLVVVVKIDEAGEDAEQNYSSQLRVFCRIFPSPSSILVFFSFTPTEPERVGFFVWKPIDQRLVQVSDSYESDDDSCKSDDDACELDDDSCESLK